MSAAKSAIITSNGSLFFLSKIHYETTKIGAYSLEIATVHFLPLFSWNILENAGINSYTETGYLLNWQCLFGNLSSFFLKLFLVATATVPHLDICSIIGTIDISALDFGWYNCFATK